MNQTEKNPYGAGWKELGVEMSIVVAFDPQKAILFYSNGTPV